ncbi:DUF167 domain-containing protein [Phormidesmis sp. 146-35]
MTPPVEGKANEELIKLLAKEFDVPNSSLTIKSGDRLKQRQFDERFASLLDPGTPPKSPTSEGL